MDERIVCEVDDIICFERNQEDHDSNLAKFLEESQTVGLCLNKEKCQQKEINFLGHEILKEGIRPDLEKFRAISALAALVNKTEVQSF